MAVVPDVDWGAEWHRARRRQTMLVVPRVAEIVQVFWGGLFEEGLYGALDKLAYHYIDDRYVPHHWFTGCSYPEGCGRYGHDS